MREAFNNVVNCAANANLFTMFANVRFDMKIKEDIAFHSMWGSFNASIRAHRPNPSLGYQDKTTGSDIFEILNEFVMKASNLCGSIVSIVAKRYPTKVDGFDDLIAILRKNHVLVYIVFSDTPSGGSNNQALYSLSSKTNGICVFTSDDEYSSTVTQFESNVVYGYIFHVSSKNAIVSGSGSVTVPFIVHYGPFLQQVNIALTFLDHKFDKTITSLNSTISDSDGNIVSSYFYIPHCDFHDQLINESPFVNDSKQYFYTVYYEYVDGVEDEMEIRVDTYNYVPDYWPPYDN